ncbi:hypothetical protein [uncultured Corynebacterium sp.]|uniref:hypothetical protein n=1 Tax=uncultured Corynebacterium sp. TaxID=159447 RepID=UPI0025D2848F|nr:hypothetical protein [uncultured Corynebacterium sp.]
MVTGREELTERYQRIVDNYMAEVEESVREFEETLKECTRQLEEAKKAQGDKANKSVGGTNVNAAAIKGARGVRGRIFD